MDYPLRFDLPRFEYYAAFAAAHKEAAAYHPYAKANSELTGAGADFATFLGNMYGVPWMAIPARSQHAVWANAERSIRFYERPDWEMDKITIGKGEKAKPLPVVSEIHSRSKFWKSVGFGADVARNVEEDFTLQVVPPLSGHHPQLVRPMPQGLVKRPNARVRVLEWEDPRQIPADGDDFDLSGQIDAVLDDLEDTYRKTGKPAASTIAICQPVPAVAAAVALMCMTKNPAKPSSMVLIAGPWDPRANPTANNELVKQVPFDLIERHLKYPIPEDCDVPGVGRDVLPGFINAGAFAAENAAKHLIFAPMGHMTDVVSGNRPSADKHTHFYDNYWAFMDIYWAHARQTIDIIFRKNEMPKGKFVYRGKRKELYGKVVDFSAITDVATLIVEAEKDPICLVGQTAAFLKSCPQLPKSMQMVKVMKDAGHYGTFAGSEAEKLRHEVMLPFIEKHHAARLARDAAHGNVRVLMQERAGDTARPKLLN